ncbi:MAG: hypothetical protein F4066_02025 [Chloroflexi bacterium]|nr:hypothetical protein [Chloroflexota bacterium]MYF82082.1 hypothetical protein [Chloroflexota bacterium]MYI03625.1 hypothetical protein [Chloroflexota bacterium]
MSVRRWLIASAALCIAAGLGTLVIALLCIADVTGGQCELWLLGPLLALPLGFGLGLIGQAAGRLPQQEHDEYAECDEPGG